MRPRSRLRRGLAARRSATALGAAFFAVAAGCGRASSLDRVERVDSAGVEVVTSLAEDRRLSASLRQRFALGGEDEGPGSFYRISVSTVGADRAGRIHILDLTAHRVVVYDRRGRFVRTLGREGGGPGELEVPASLSVGSAGDVAVFDFGKMALVRWDSAGTPLSPLPFPHPSLTPGRHFVTTPDGYLVSSWSLVGDARVSRLLSVRDGDTTVLATAPQPDRGLIMFEACGGGISFPPLFTPTIAWDHRDGTTAVTSGDGYRIDIHRDGRLVRSIRRPFPLTEANRELATAEAGEGLTVQFGARPPCTITPADYVDARGWAPTVPAIRAVALAPDGSLWVRRWVPGADPMPIDRFDSEGAYMGTLPEGTEMPAVFVGHDAVGVVREDDVGVQRIVVGEMASDDDP